MYDAIWYCNGKEIPVVVKSYLGKINNREYVAIEESTTGIPLDQVWFVDGNSLVSAWIDPRGNINLCE